MYCYWFDSLFSLFVHFFSFRCLCFSFFFTQKDFFEQYLAGFFVLFFAGVVLLGRVKERCFHFHQGTCKPREHLHCCCFRAAIEVLQRRCIPRSGTSTAVLLSCCSIRNARTRKKKTPVLTFCLSDSGAGATAHLQRICRLWHEEGMTGKLRSLSLSLSLSLLVCIPTHALAS